MEHFELKEDIEVFCVKASSFPEGVQQAHDSLHALVSFDPARKYFGISQMDKNNSIVYKAAAEELEKGELSKHGLDHFIIRKGNYLGKDIPNFMNHLSEIGKTFQQLIHREDIDPDGAAVEWYITQEDCRCMVRLKDK